MANAAIVNNLKHNDETTEEEQLLPKKPENVENHTMKLKCYSMAYTGHARIARLIYISEVCPSLSVDALRMALDFVKQYTANMTKYEKLTELLKIADPIGVAPDDGDARRSAEVVEEKTDDWLQVTSKSIALERDQLDAEMLENTALKLNDATQPGFERYAEHFLRQGDLMGAHRMYLHMRENCDNNRAAVKIWYKLIRVLIYMEKWTDVISDVTNAVTLESPTEPTQTLLQCAAGVAEMVLGNYRNAAEHFVIADIDHCDMPDILSQNNAAQYGGLCALATFERAELQERVLRSTTFGHFLDIEPLVREAITSFVDAKYSQCLTALEKLRETLLLDIYIGPHVHILYKAIRKRSLIQYALPFSAADMGRMAATFQTDVPNLGTELFPLLSSGELPARIDAHRNILYMTKVNAAVAARNQIIANGRDYLRRFKMSVLRMAIIKAGLVVQCNPR